MTLLDTLEFPGGAERIAAQIAARLDHERFESHFCAYADPPGPARTPAEAVDAELRAAGIEPLRLGRAGRYDLRVWRRFAGELRRRRIDVLHSHKFGPNVWASIVGPLSRVPALVCHEHTWSYEGQTARRLLDRQLIARAADRFVAVSHEDARRMTEVEGIPAGRIRTIANGVPSAARAGDRARVRAELGIADDTTVVGALGHVRPQKNYGVLVEALARLRDRHPHVVLVIAGELRPEWPIEPSPEACGVADRVMLLDHRNDVADVMAAFDIAVNSSDFEGMPLSVMECMRAGLPMVATRVGAVPEIVLDGETGLLVPPRDPAALAEALGRLLDEPARAADMGRRGAERIAAEFSLDGTVSAIEGLYEELAGTRA